MSGDRPWGRKFAALRNNIRVFGLADTARAVLAHFHLVERPSPDSFDATRGVQTDGEIDVDDSDITGPAREHAVKYQPTHERVMEDVLQSLPVDPAGFTFVDLGCGKGRALLMAAEHGFARVVGVEVSAAYCEAARDNVARVGATGRVEIVRADVQDAELPDGDLVLYLFNPFTAPVLARVMERVRAARERSPRRLLIAYCNPEAGTAPLEEAGFRLARHTEVIVPEWSWSLWEADGPA